MNAYKKIVKVTNEKLISIDFERCHNCVIVCDDKSVLDNIKFTRMIINRDNEDDLWILNEIKEARYLRLHEEKFKFLIALIDIRGMKSDAMHMVRKLLASTWGAGISILLFSDLKTWEKHNEIGTLIGHHVIVNKKGEVDDNVWAPIIRKK